MLISYIFILQFILQRAMKEHQIDVQEVQKDVLGTEHEKKVPHTNSS